MAHGPHSAQKRARKVRKANRMAQALGFCGAKHLMAVNETFQVNTPLIDAAVAAIVAGY